MARRGRRRSRNDSRRRRGILNSTNRRLLDVAMTPIDWRTVEDRRQWHPDGLNRPAAAFRNQRHRLIYAESTDARRRRNAAKKGSLYPSPRIGFADPHKILICARRQIRKQVLHALRKVGKGIGRKKPKFNQYSKVGC